MKAPFLSIVAGCSLLSACGLNEDYVRRDVTSWDDRKLLSSHVGIESNGFLGESLYSKVIFEEMQKRGLIGKGTDPKPAR